MSPDKSAILARAETIYSALGTEPTPKHVRCPFPDHEDRNPSFRLDGKGGWICSCGAGDVISFVERMKGLDFVEAIAVCWDILGAEPPKPKAAKPAKPSTTGKYARDIWSRVTRSDNAVSSHPYAMRKAITHAFGAGRALVSGSLIGQGADCIVVPIRHEGTGDVVSVQCINEEGVKQTFGSMEGAYLLLGDERDQKAEWFVVEGWATAWAIRVVKPQSVAIVAFGKSRLEPVAFLAAEKYEPVKILILEDAA